ncbi:MAG: hypothetical protein FJX34_04480 [Alphaproteobacteria bacterium]|nr:hypothetical protein [Alphaproteobacteria bacterium]
MVKISWTNADGNNVSREFFFRKANLPSIDDHTTYNYVQLYFDQHYVEITTSDAPDLSGKTAKMDQMLNFYREQYAKGGDKAKDDTQLISVQPKRDTSVPGWLLSSY